MQQRGNARALGLGVWLDGHDDPSTLIGELADLRVIAIRIPSFTDGRAYSTARLLRERYGYRGELRAIGNVLQDQLWELSQCGFDAFALADGQDPVAALAALKEFSDHYQATAAQPQPLFRRRLLPASSEAA